MTACWRLILNGKAATDEAVREAVHALRERVALQVRVTWERGDAARYAREAAEQGVDTLVSGGGDGTLGEIVAVLAERDGPRVPSLGLLPLGTGNDFATAAAVPEAPLEALELIHRQPARAVDVLRVQAHDGDAAPRLHWCVNLASGGFGTQVTVETDEGLKKLLGGLAYLVTGIARLGRIEPVRARLVGPDFAWEGGFLALGIGNGRQAGGGQVLCPKATIDDGRLDVTVVPELEGELGGTVGTLLTEGRQAALERVAATAQLPWVHLDADAPLTLNLDGEPVTASRFRIECVGGRLRMHLPPDSPLLSPPATPLPAPHPDEGEPPPAVVPV